MRDLENSRVVRRWGFYIDNRLAYAGVAIQSPSSEIGLRFMEAEHHPHTSTLPQRMDMERLIREQVQADLDQDWGSIPVPLFRFESTRRSEHRLAVEIFGALAARPLPGS